MGLQGSTKYAQMKKLIVYYFFGLSTRINFRPVIKNPSSLLAGKSNAVKVSQVLIELCDKVKYNCCNKYQTKTWMVHSSTDLDSPIPNILTKTLLGWTSGYDLVLCENSDKTLSLKSSSDVVGTPATTDCDLDKGDRYKLSDLNHVNVTESYGDSTSEIDFQIDESNDSESNDSEDTRVKREIASVDQYLSLDCGFVGDLPKVSTDEQLGNYLRGCSIVDFDGNVVYDMKICGKDTLTDCHKRYNGRHADHNIDGVSFEDVRKAVINLLKGKILVGYDVKHDLSVLQIEHPAEMTRDVQFNESVRKNAAELGCQNGSLKSVSLCLLGRNIQKHPTHSSVEDATATMDLFKLVREEWEKCLTNPDYIDIDTPTPHPSLTQSTDCLSVQDKAPKTDISDDSERGNHIENTMKPQTSSPDRMKGTMKPQTSSPDRMKGTMKPQTSSPDRMKVLNPVKFLHKNCRSLGWDPPLYRFDSLTQETFICKVLVNGREYQSQACSTRKEAKNSAAEAFFTHHQRSDTDTYIDIMDQFFSNTKVDKYSGLDVVSALNVAAQKFGWVPRYQFDTLPSGQCVCKALIDGKEYWSGPCSGEKEAKFAAAEAFFACHQKSENDTYTEVLQSWMKKPKKKPQAVEVHGGMSLGFFLHATCVQHNWPIHEYKLVSKTSSEGGHQYIYKVVIHKKEFYGKEKNNWKLAKQDAAKTCISKLKQICYIDS